MTKEQLLAYLAGCIDCDGHISIQRTRKTVGEKYAHRPIYYIAKIGFVSTDEIVPRLFLNTFGGSWHEHQPKNSAHKRWYVWQTSSNKAGEVIALLLPYLQLKKPQAEATLEFLALVKSQRNRSMSQRITPEIEEGRRLLWEKVTKFNAPRNRRVHFVEPPESEIQAATL